MVLNMSVCVQLGSLSWSEGFPAPGSSRWSRWVKTSWGPSPTSKTEPVSYRWARRQVCYPNKHNSRLHLALCFSTLLLKTPCPGCFRDFPAYTHLISVNGWIRHFCWTAVIRRTCDKVGKSLKHAGQWALMTRVGTQF